MEDRKVTFECTMCGFCCSEEGYVFFSDDEIKKAANRIGITEEDFISKYLQKDAFGVYRHEVEKGAHCVFLVNNLCAINQCKPAQCATFPYWKEYTDKKGNIILSKFDRQCPGVK